jgi:hypothetical protein
MEALKRSLAQDSEPEPRTAAGTKPTRAKVAADRPQRALMLPVSGGRERTDAAVTKPMASTVPKRREKAVDADSKRPEIAVVLSGRSY